MAALSRPEVWIPLAAVLVGFSMAALFRVVTLHYARRRGSRMAAAMARHATRPVFLLLPAFLGRFVQPLLDLAPSVTPSVRHAVTVLLILSFAWLLISVLAAFDEYLREGFFAGGHDDRRARRILTRLGFLYRVLSATIAVLAAAAILVTFPEGRTMGASILASAGIAGIVLGIAARPAVETLLAGLQVALTEPFSIDDVVVVEGEWGRIEEITSTYVVVRIWDLRRLVLPLQYFLQKPFQNWSRSGTALLAQVTLEVDYSTPVEALRQKAGEIVASSRLWDKASWSLQVTETGARTMRLRVVASAADSALAWDLRCEIRENLISYLQERYPSALPRTRATVETGPVGSAGVTAAQSRD